MRTGIYLPRVLRPYSIDFDGFGRALAAQGHEAVMVCHGAESEFHGEVVKCDGQQEACEDFWRALNLQRVFFYNWMKRPEILRAARGVGIYSVTRADSDGMLSARVFPQAMYRRLVDPAKSPFDFLRRFRHFLNWYQFHWRQHDEEALQVIAESDRIAVETASSLANFRRFLEFHGRGKLIEKFGVVSHAVPDLFLDVPVAPASGRCDIFCGGRWDDDQKDARLLRRSIPGILRAIPGGRIRIAGSGVSEEFEETAARFPRVKLEGRLDRRELPRILAGCRFLLSSSRWESHPIGALEALCCGCTVVSTPTPGFVDIAGGAVFGTISTGHTPDGLAHAAASETALWDGGRREPEKIASHWRGLVGNNVVAEGLLKL